MPGTPAPAVTTPAGDRYDRRMDRTVAIASVETPLGRYWVAATGDGVIAVAHDEEPAAILAAASRLLPGRELVIDEVGLAWATTQLGAWCAGAITRLEVPIDPGAASDFDRRVWEAVRAIPYGATATYGEVALMAGAPGAARAVGGALARCPLTPIVPCHRVVHAGGGIGGWGGSLSGKRRLLEHEARHAPR